MRTGNWTEEMWARKINLDRGDRICLGKIEHTLGGKRIERGEESNVQSRERRMKRMKYFVANEVWGLVGLESGENKFLFFLFPIFFSFFLPKSPLNRHI